MANHEHNGDHNSDTALLTKKKTRTSKPRQYKVLLLNDDYTPMDFVVAVLMKIFTKSEDEATRIMLQVHHSGMGECGIYSFEIAETKVMQVMDLARQYQHPLQCVMDEA